MSTEQDSGEMRPLIVFDTGNTTVELDFKKFNPPFLEYALKHPEKLGYSREEAEKLAELYDKNKKDPVYMKESAPGKVKFIEQGFFPIKFFPDTLDFFVEAAENDIELATTSKGGLEILHAIYEKELPEEMTISGRSYRTYCDFLRRSDGPINIYSTSAPEFKHKDKTDPRCYEEFILKMMNEGRQVLSYTSDDIKEVTAAKECSDMLKCGEISQLQKGIAPIFIPVDEHKESGAPSIAEGNGIFVVNNLPFVVDTSLEYQR